MKKQLLPALVVIAVLFTIISCQKTVDDFDPGGGGNTSLTVSNLAGTYALKSVTVSFLGTSYNVYDSLNACEKDDLYTFNADLTMKYTDAGIACTPPGDGNGTWALRNDSVFISTSADAGKIKSFDGSTLVLTGTPAGLPGATATTTFVKK